MKNMNLHACSNRELRLDIFNNKCSESLLTSSFDFTSSSKSNHFIARYGIPSTELDMG